MKRNTVIILLFTLSLTSCFELLSDAAENISNASEASPSLSESNFQVVTIDSLYQLSVPKHMKNMPSLHPEASLGYANLYKEAYTVVIHENKQEFIDTFREFEEYNDSISPIENYRDVQKNMFREAVNNARFQDYGLSQINGLPARQIKLFGDIDNIDFFYLIAFVEGDENIYMIMNWTNEERQMKLENTYEFINGTFKTL